MSLDELRKLVPAANEKQGSAKLEKAEILQMTVDHLKALSAKGEFTFVGFVDVSESQNILRIFSGNVRLYRLTSPLTGPKQSLS